MTTQSGLKNIHSKGQAKDVMNNYCGKQNEKPKAVLFFSLQ